MKFSKNVLLTIFSAFPLSLLAQLPNGSVRSTATADPLPGAYTNTTTNYIRTWEPNLPLSVATDVNTTTRTVREVKQATEYYDGLGRVQQTVAKGMSYRGQDIVVPVIYDQFDHEVYKYLPYTQTTDNTNDGKFKTAPFSAQKTFYQDNTLNPGMAGESIFYRKVEFEPSAIGRVLKTYSPGNSWSTRPAERQYLLNTLDDSVRIWNLGTAIPTSTTIYPANVLYKEVLIDEGGNKIIVYKDKENKLILKKEQLSGSTTAAHAGWLCTYYVYNNTRNLGFVIPPQATQYAMTHNWNVSAVEKELCFRKTYDDRNRVVIEQRPGTGRIFYVYDVRDRPAFTQDSVQRMKSPMEWTVVLYDARNRAIMKGTYSKTATREELQTSMDNAPASASISYNFPLTADLSVSTDDGSAKYVATNSITLLPGFTSADNREFTVEINSDGTGNATSITATNPLPDLSSASLVPLIYMYYDNYNYDGKLNFKTDDLSKPQAADTLYPEALPSVYSTLTNGLVTGLKVRVIGTNRWLTTTTYYNDKGRPIQVVSDNSVGGKDILTTLYSFNGNILSTYLRHQNPKSVIPELTTLTNITYDHAGRLMTIKRRLNDLPAFERTIASYTYDELGQLIKKKLGVKTDGKVIDSITYSYNIRGWMNGINNDFVKTAGSTSNWFGESISYDYGFSTSYYNGSIAGTMWKSRSDGIARAYGYSYDKTNRMISAEFNQQNTANASWSHDKMDFSVSNLNYDANGNILSMKQTGVNATTIEQMDDLTYAYQDNSNKLSAVTDANTKTSTTLGDFINGTNGGDDYAYDGNGNMIKDLNKNITSITYNFLNLPSVINISGKGTISYEYDALGNHLKKTVVDNNGVSTVTDYAGGFEYKRDTLQQVGHEEGRIRPLYNANNAVSFAFDYLEKDHLGNVRMVLTDQPDSSLYAASMETAAAQTETALFSNIEETRVEKPSGYPDTQTPAANKYVAKLNGNSEAKKMGPSLVLRVMAGDTICIKSDAFYKSQSPVDNNKKSPIQDIATTLAQALLPGLGQTGAHSSALADNVNARAVTNNNVAQRLTDLDNEGDFPDRPKAYLNYVLFDDQFNLVESNCGNKQVKSTPDEIQQLTVEKTVMEKTGFLYVFTDNQTAQDVYFDNLIVAVTNGPVLEETHYYPFGLTMEAISSNALKGLNYAENKLKFNCIQVTRDLGLNQYDAFYRTLDPQLGRWLQADPKPVEGASPYAAMYNNPVLITDLLGDTGRIGTNTLATVVIRGTTYNKTTLINNILTELTRITGLNLDVVNGVLVNKGVLTNKGISRTARREIKNMIKSKGNVYIDFTSLPSQRFAFASGTSNTESYILLNPAEIEASEAGTSADLDPYTFGWGMTILHELGHTYLHGNFLHDPATIDAYGNIDETDVRTNKIRQELGTNWGQRTSYTSLPIGTKVYLPMSESACDMLQNAIPHIRNASRMKNPIMKANEMNFPVPSTGVIITPR